MTATVARRCLTRLDARMGARLKYMDENDFQSRPANYRSAPRTVKYSGKREGPVGEIADPRRRPSSRCPGRHGAVGRKRLGARRGGGRHGEGRSGGRRAGMGGAGGRRRGVRTGPRARTVPTPHSSTPPAPPLLTFRRAHYSARSADDGSTLAARAAGIHVASTDTTTSATATDP